MLGASYAGHPPIRTFKVRIKNPNHPITKGVRDFVITDEQHYMEYDKDPTHIFLETVNEEGCPLEPGIHQTPAKRRPLAAAAKLARYGPASQGG